MRRSSSIYRSFSALAALIRFSLSLLWSSPFADVYSSFATDGCIFQLETLARSLGDSCAEKKYLLALVDLGRAALITVTYPVQRYDGPAIRVELLDAIRLQRYVPSPPTRSHLMLFLQSPQRRLYCFSWQSVHHPRKSIHFPLLVASHYLLLHR